MATMTFSAFSITWGSAVDVIQNGRDIRLVQVERRSAFSCDIALADPGSRSATVLLKFSLEALENFFGEFVDAQLVISRNIVHILARRLHDAKILVTSNVPN